MSMEIWTKVAQFFMSLSLLIILHELGHFTLAKLFKTRVENFTSFLTLGFRCLSLNVAIPSMG